MVQNNPITEPSPDFTTVSPFTYRGYCYDYDIGMYYLQSRYYDPEICRFINADSTDYLGATGTLLSYNLFAYCENDGVNFVDETGTIYTYNVKKGKVTGKFEKPAYSPDKWNSNYLKKANCYAYALNLVVNYKGTKRQDGRIDPGEISGKHFLEYKSYSTIICIREALIADLKVMGLKCLQVVSLTNKTREQKRKEKNGYYVALVVTDLEKDVAVAAYERKTFWDYHWYRLDYNTFGRWSHKRGLTKVTNVDAKNKYITDVAKAKRNYGYGANYSSPPAYFLIYK